jgi:ABC-type dipeptide/oligopeptide/nickel transport system permease subunit
LILENRTLQKLLERNSARVGIIIAVFLIILTLIAPLVLTFEPNAQNPAEKLLAPGFEHLLGTDQYGRDVLARIADGASRSLGAAVLVLAGTLFLSLIAGITVGMLGGIVDSMVMRVVDVFLALPSLILALAAVGVLGVGFENLLVALIFSSLAYYMRLARSYALNAGHRQDVIVARLAGVSWTRIIFGHIAPDILTQMVIVATLDLGGVIVAFAGLSFLGLGVQPPDAEWGAMLNESRLFFTNAPWLLLAPAGAIFLSVVAANLIGNALRDASNNEL